MNGIIFLKIGGNRRAREFFEDQPDYNDSMTIQQKYNTKAAALYRDKISTLAQGQSWDQKKSSAANFSAKSSSSHSSMTHSRSSGSLPLNNENYNSDSYQNSGSGYQSSASYQNFNTKEFKDQKEAYFSQRQQENAMRPE